MYFKLSGSFEDYMQTVLGGSGRAVKLNKFQFSDGLPRFMFTYVFRIEIFHLPRQKMLRQFVEVWNLFWIIWKIQLSSSGVETRVSDPGLRLDPDSDPTCEKGQIWIRSELSDSKISLKSTRFFLDCMIQIPINYTIINHSGEREREQAREKEKECIGKD